MLKQIYSLAENLYPLDSFSYNEEHLYYKKMIDAYGYEFEASIP